MNFLVEQLTFHFITSTSNTHIFSLNLSKAQYGVTIHMYNSTNKFCLIPSFRSSSIFWFKAVSILIFEAVKWTKYLTLSWRGPISYRNQSIDLRRKSMDWFLYDIGLRHERVKYKAIYKYNHLCRFEKLKKRTTLQSLEQFKRWRKLYWIKWN